ncbi:MAG: hypothetical protein JNN15_01830 [Blastocatellia bacterium]|nr:hypothetical protein [Blastocatellia bacterium]
MVWTAIKKIEVDLRRLILVFILGVFCFTSAHLASPMMLQNLLDEKEAESEPFQEDADTTLAEVKSSISSQKKNVSKRTYSTVIQTFYKITSQRKWREQKLKGLLACLNTFLRAPPKKAYIP